MALINCYNCGKNVSDRAAACPHCGAPVQRPEQQPSPRRQAGQSGAHSPYRSPSSGKTDNKNILLVILAVLLVILIAAIVGYWLSHRGESSSADNEVVREVVRETITVEKDADLSAPSAEEVPAEAVAEEYVSGAGRHIDLYSGLRHHFVGAFTYKGVDYPIELDFTSAGGTLSNIVYRNVRYGGKINMTCSRADGGVLVFNGKDAGKDFTIHVEDAGGGRYEGYAVDGSQQLSAYIRPACSHD